MHSQTAPSEQLQLRPYQQDMRAFAHRVPRCALFARMGLGKTPTTATVMADCLFDRVDVGRWLIVGPELVVADTWPNNFRRFRQFADITWRNLSARDFNLAAKVDAGTGRRMGLVIEDKRKVKRELQAMRETVHLVSWRMLGWLVKSYGKNWPYDGVVLDESIFAANTSSDMHKAVYHVVHRLKAVGRLVLLSGSPMPNGYEQLHGQVRLINPGLLGNTKSEFRQRYMAPARMNPHTGLVYDWRLLPGAKETIDSLVGQVAVSLVGGVDLPPLVVNPMRVPLPDAARTVYDGLERHLIAKVGGEDILAPSAAVLVTKLLQVASGAVYSESGIGRWQQIHDAKLDRLDELVELTPGPILLAVNFVHEWERVSGRLKKHAAHVHQPGALNHFRVGKLKLLAMHPSSGGHGLDGLQRVSSTGVWFGATYNADHWEQFNARLHRDGTTADRVIVHQLLAEDTIEEAVAGVTVPAKIAEQDLMLQAVRLRQHSHVRPCER